MSGEAADASSMATHIKGGTGTTSAGERTLSGGESEPHRPQG